MVEAVFAIRPKYAEAIYDGRKRIEWRYKVPSRDDITRVWLYETNGIRRVTGWFKFSGITPRVDYKQAYDTYGPVNITGDPETPLEYVRILFAGRRLCGLMITEAQRVDPFPLSKLGIISVPTSWRYVPEIDDDRERDAKMEMNTELDLASV